MPEDPEVSVSALFATVSNLTSIITFSHILLLLEHKHMVVEKLLELLVAEVDAHLLEAVEVEDLKTSNVQNADERDPVAKMSNVFVQGCLRWA